MVGAPNRPMATSITQGLSVGPVQNNPFDMANTWTPRAPSTNGNPTAQIDAALAVKMKAYNFTEDLPKYFMALYISDFSRQTLSRIGDLKRRETIRLPLPVNIQDFHSEAWEEYGYGMVAGLLAEEIGLEGLGGKLGVDATILGQSLLSGWFSTPTSKAGAIAGAITGADPGGRIPRAMMGVHGVAPNMFQTILYRGPKFKQPTFHLKLCPKNLTESKSIRDIINRLHIAMAPKFNQNWGRLLFDFPDIFEIAYWPNSSWLCKFKPCVLKDMYIDYTGPGHKIGFYANEKIKGSDERPRLGSDNPPEAVEITLAFQELEYWTKENFQDSPGREPIDNNPFSGANQEFKQPVGVDRLRPLENPQNGRGGGGRFGPGFGGFG